MARDIAVDLVANADAFRRDIKKAVGDTERDFQGLQRAAGLARSALAGLGAGLSVASLAGFVRSGIEAADQMGKLAAKAGTTVEAFTRLNYAANLSDVSAEQFSQALSRLGVNADKAAQGVKTQADVFARLGVTVTDANGRLKSTDQIFTDVAESISKLPDGATKSALAIGAMGRSGALLIPVLNAGRQGLSSFAAEAERLGVVIDRDTAQAADEFGDQLDRMKLASSGLAIQIGRDLLPVLTDIATDMRIAYQQGGLLQAVLVGIGDVIGTTFRAIGETNPIAALKREFQEFNLTLTEFDASVQRSLADLFGDTKFGRFKSQKAEEATQAAARLRNALLSPASGGSGGRSRQLARQPGISPAPTEPVITPAGADSGFDAQKQAVKDVLAFFKQAEKERQALAKESAEVEAYLTDQVRERAKLFEASKQATREEIQGLVDATRTPAEQYAREVKRLLSLKGSGLDEDTFQRGVQRAREEFEQLRDASKETSDAMRDLGITFQSAFEDAVVNGAAFSEVLKGIGQDIVRIGLQELITKPAGDLLQGLFSGGGGGGGGGIGGFFKSLFGGFRASGGPVSAGRGYVVGENGPELFFPGANGAIAANGGGVNVVINNYSGAQVQTRDRGSAGGRRQIEVLVRAGLGDLIHSGAGAQVGLAAPMVSR